MRAALSSHPSALGSHGGTLPASTTLEEISGSRTPISIYPELGEVARPETWGQSSAVGKTHFLRTGQLQKGSQGEEEVCPLEKTTSAFDGPTAAQQLLAFHTAHLVVIVPSKFCPSPDSPEGEEKGDV